MSDDAGKVEKPRPKPIAPKAPEPSVGGVVEGTSAGTGLSSILEERKDVADKAIFRMSGGTQGTAPLPDLAARRAAPVHEALRRIARKSSGAASAGPAKIPESGGVPLGQETRSKLEPKLGADLSSVRIHTGGESQAAATHYGARALTVGNDIHFNSGEFKPGTKEGDRLIGHELTHVVQGNNSGGVQRKAEDPNGDAGAAGGEHAHGEEVSQPGDPAEVEADAMGDHVADTLHEDAGGDAKGGAKPGGAKGAGKGGKGAGAKGEAAGAPGKDAAAGGEEPPPGVGVDGAPPVKEGASPKIAAKLDASGPKVYRKPGGIVGPDGKTPAGQHQPAGGGARAQEMADIKPILGKLRQAIEMFAHWAGKGTVPEAQTMLRKLETAREEAQALSELQAKGTPASTLADRKAKLSAQLQAIQILDPKYQLVSVGDLARTLDNAKKKMPTVTPTKWKCPVKKPEQLPEFQRQLKDQQDGINSMLADTWDKNKDKYKVSGRSNQAKNQQKEFQKRSGNKPGTAAPHNSDGFGGGHPDPTGLPANASVNSSIGSQWGGDRKGAIDRSKPISDAVKTIPALEQLITQMDVRLEVELAGDDDE